jgi:hypothetical protein
MNKTRNIIILIIVFILLSVGYLALNQSQKKKVTVATKAATEKLSIGDEKNLNKVIIKSKTATLTLEKKGANWIANSLTSIKVNTSSITSILTSITSLTPGQIVEKSPKDLSIYGLKDPSSIVTASFSDGSVKELSVGNTTVNGDYYLMVKGDENVYVVPQTDGSHLQYALSDVIDKSLTQIDTQSLTYILIDHKDGKPIEIQTNTSQSAAEKQAGIDNYSMTKPYDIPYGVDSQKFSDLLLSKMPTFAIQQLVDADAKDLSKYGLDKPTLELKLKDSKNSLHLIFGKDADNSNIYFKTDASNSVYTMAKSDLSTFNVSPFDLVAKLIYLTNIDNVDKILIEYAGNTNEFTIDRKTVKAQKTGDPDTVTSTFKVDGVEVKDPDFRTFYQSLIGISADAELDKTVQENPEFKITYYLNKGDSKVDKIEFCPYNNDFYAAFINGKAQFVVSKSQIQKIIDGIATVKKAKK